MSNLLTRQRGTEDIYYEYSDEINAIVKHCYKIAHKYSYTNIETPIFESKSLFVRSVGETTDVVHKELYEFKDKSNREIALRPEGTASVIRAIIENKLLQKYQNPLKLCYYGPMFRYERPQSGRLRQFHQFGIECINSKTYNDDLEVLIFAYDIINELGIKDVYISINNIGNITTRTKWVKALSKYFEKYHDQLTEDSINRINTNPLRILDDKIDVQKDFVKNAPSIDKFLSNEEIDYFDKIISGLKKQNVHFKIDKTLVRGLDYYTNFVFEIKSNSPKLAAQSTLIGGGRYNNLVEMLGGPKDTYCVGFAGGIERIAIALRLEGIKLGDKKYTKVLVASLNEVCDSYCFNIMKLLRKCKIEVHSNFNTYKIKNHLHYANKNNIDFIAIIGEDELKQKTVMLKNLHTFKQESVKLNLLVKEIKK